MLSSLLCETGGKEQLNTVRKDIYITSPVRLQMAYPNASLDALGFPDNALGRIGVWHSSLERRGGQGRVRGGVVSSKVSPSVPLRRRGSNMRHRSLWPSHPALACL